MNTDLFTLPNGLRIVSSLFPESEVEYFGIAVNAGSTFEANDQHGLAHFVEHTIFKGTHRHTSNYIVNKIEKIGGELNAFTTKEETLIYTITPSGNINKCIDLISELVSESIFPKVEIEKEKSVIIEEIYSYLDNPSEAIFDEMDEKLFAGTPLAHNILGSQDSVLSFNSDECKKWLASLFTTDNSVVFYSGPIKGEKIARIIERTFQKYPIGKKINVDFDIPPVNFSSIVDNQKFHQCHVAIGFQIPGYKWEGHIAMQLLANILGGPSMNSILNMKLREERGLVYNIDAYTSFYNNGGSLIIYYGCDKNDLEKCKSLIETELRKISHNKMDKVFLEQRKKQILGQLTIGWDNREQGIMNYARSLLKRNLILSHSEIRNNIHSITPDNFAEITAYLEPEKGSFLALL